MKTAPLKALAANRLSDGITVWAVKNGTGFTWTENWADIVPSSLEEDHAELEAFANQQAKADKIVSERLLEVIELDDGSFTPQRMRERICTAGPTFRLDLGKQAQFASRSAAA